MALENDVNYPNSYGWIAIQSLTAALSLQNSDNYAYFGLMAGLADGFFRLIDTDAQKTWNGVLVYDAKIPPEKRSLEVDGYTRTHARDLA